MPLIEKISASNPEIHFDVRPSDTISDVVESQIDIGIRVGSQLTSNRFIARSVAKIRHVIVATPALIAKYGIPKTPNDLHNLPTTLLMDKNKSPLGRTILSIAKISSSASLAQLVRAPP